MFLRWFKQLYHPQISFKELYFEEVDEKVLKSGREDGNTKVKKDVGIGLRVLDQNHRSLYFATNELTKKGLKYMEQKMLEALEERNDLDFYEDIVVQSIMPSKEGKLYIPKKTDDLVRIGQWFAKQTQSYFLECRTIKKNVTIINSNGLECSEQTERTSISFQCTVNEGSYTEISGGKYDRSIGLGKIDYQEVFEKCQQTYQLAKKRIEAKKHDVKWSKPRRIPIIFKAGIGGIFIHEVIGHMFELDQTPPYMKNIDTIGNENVTIVDEGLYKNEIASCNFDDEGFPTFARRLVVNGVVTDFLTDYRESILTQRRPGSARRAGFKFPPMPRMFNTYLESASTSKTEIFQQVGGGIFIEDIHCGNIDYITGDFKLIVRNATIIRNGHTEEPIVDMIISGSTHNILHKICHIGNDLIFESGICTKKGQSVPVSFGSPTISLDDVEVLSLGW